MPLGKYLGVAQKILTIVSSWILGNLKNVIAFF
jgi:hypothetical protein